MLTHFWGIHLTHPGEKDRRGKCFENCLDELLGQSNSSLCASSNPSRALGAPFRWRLLENTSIGHRGKIITIIQASFLLVAVLWCCQSKFGAEKTFSIVFLTRNLCAVLTSQQLLPFWGHRWTLALWQTIHWIVENELKETHNVDWPAWWTTLWIIYSVCWGQVAATFCLQNTNGRLAVGANMCIGMSNSSLIHHQTVDPSQSQTAVLAR